MPDEIYEPWYCENLSRPMKVSLKSFSYHANSSLDIHVWNISNSDQQLIIRFPELPIAMRITNESQRLVSLNGVPEGFSHFINIVRKSNFISWLNTDSLGIYKDDPWIHLSIIADDEWIDIITSDFPEIIFNVSS
jgi:hypothetical protein